MKKPAHTPPPWKINSTSMSGDCHICSEEYGHIAILTCDSSSEIERTEANAKLICAAPDLFEALQDLLKFHGGWSVHSQSVYHKAKRALSKAVDSEE